MHWIRNAVYMDNCLLVRTVKTHLCPLSSFFYYIILCLTVVLCCRAIMTMDAREQFPVDMVEQMLKFTPSPEERALLDEHAEEIDHLARADRFLFELSK